MPQELISLRRMRKDDIETVLEIERSSFSNPWQPTAFEGEIDNVPFSNPFVILYSPKKSVIGYVIYWQVGEEVQIANIAIHPEYRRLGIAEVVLHSVLDRIRADGARFVLLEVRPSNEAAQKLYAKLGFKRLGLRKGYYTKPPEDALLMGMTL